MSRSPSGRKRNSGDWAPDSRRSTSPCADDVAGARQSASRTSTTSTVRSMLRRTSSSRSANTESTRRRSRRSSYKESTRSDADSRPPPTPAARASSHKKQRLYVPSSPPQPPQQSEDSPDHEPSATAPSEPLPPPPPPHAERRSSLGASQAPPPPGEEKDEEEGEEEQPAKPELAELPSTTEPEEPPAPAAASQKEERKKSGKPAEEDEEEEGEPTNVAAPNFGLSGKLAAETNTVNGVVLKYAEPPEARKPKDRWRLYVFKDGKDIDMHHVDRASGYLFGRDRKVADVPTDHPSCSSQHAVLQFRLIKTSSSNAIKPYLIDLSSTNGTFLNGEPIPTQRYVELRSEDVIKFGFSTREYVLLSE